MFEPQQPAAVSGRSEMLSSLRGKAFRTQALSDGDLARAEAAARRLHAELRGVIGLLPEVERGASAMSRLLGLDRATCQRIVAAVSRPDVGAATLVQLPGVLGLRQFVQAMARRGGEPGVLDAAKAAIDHLETLILELAGSQRRLRERLTASSRIDDRFHLPNGRNGCDDVRVRESLFHAAAQVTGRWADTTIFTRLIRPVPGSPRQTEFAITKGLIGHGCRAEAVPLVVGYEAILQTEQTANPAFATLDAKLASGETPSALLRPFCSSPLPRVISRSEGTRTVVMVDTTEGPEDGTSDIVLAARHVKADEHPATLNPPVGEVWALMTFPSRALVFDTYLHRDIARKCIPALETHLWEPDIGKQGSSRWATRFPGGPRLEVLGPGLSGAGTTMYPRQVELTGYLFDQLGWPAEEFVGYRCEVEYPVWRAGYCMVFDFTGNEIR